jgi:hypothetical protein
MENNDVIVNVNDFLTGTGFQKVLDNSTKFEAINALKGYYGFYFAIGPIHKYLEGKYSKCASVIIIHLTSLKSGIRVTVLFSGMIYCYFYQKPVCYMPPPPLRRRGSILFF